MQRNKGICHIVVIYIFLPKLRMNNHSHSNYSAGIIGGGSFGLALANLMAETGQKILLLTRHREQCEQVALKIQAPFAQQIIPVYDASFFMQHCRLIILVIPSKDFEDVLWKIKPFTTPNHVFIHGTKGIHIQQSGELITVETMSQLMHRILVTERVACLAGPNLAREISEGKPAATVIASQHRDILEMGGNVLRSNRFQVLYNDDIYGIELCGVLKNIMAIASGAASGLEVGDNAKALLVNRALIEMIHIGSQLGASVKSFYGVAGMGDLIATCYSSHSRNYSVGYRLARGESFAQISASMDETAEGVNTTRLIYQLAEQHHWKTPITKMVYKVLFEEFPVNKAIAHLMKLPVREDIGF